MCVRACALLLLHDAHVPLIDSLQETPGGMHLIPMNERFVINDNLGSERTDKLLMNRILATLSIKDAVTAVHRRPHTNCISNYHSDHPPHVKHLGLGLKYI